MQTIETQKKKTIPIKTVVKNNGERQKFDLDKLVNSVHKSIEEIKEIPQEQVAKLLENIMRDLSIQEEEVTTKTLRDIIERNYVNLIVEYPLWEEVAKRYVLARIYNQVFGKNNWTKFDERDLSLTYNALKVLEARYLLKDPETLKYIETPQMLFRRVAKFISIPEKGDKRDYYENEFYRLMSELRFIPNSPTLMNAGTRNGVLSACYVIPVRDAIATKDGEGIHDALRAQALIQKEAGGTGFDFSELRPEGDVVKSTSGVASGPLSFMRLFDVNTDVIKQGGKRRGANMGILHIWHPDIRKFIKSKTGSLKDVHLQNFNISVGLYDAFMKAVEEDKKFPLINPRRTWLRNTKEHDSRFYAIVRARHYITEEWVQEQIYNELENNDWNIPLHESKIITWDEALAIAENENAIVEWVKARELFNEIVHGAWDSGDPGIVMIDEINRRHPTWYLGKINATNPCSEQPLLDWESCNLGSINLEKYVITNEKGKPKIDWDSLAHDVSIAVRFLDNVIDMNRHPLPQIDEANKRTRKIGLGIMGWAHMLAKLKIPYDSPEAAYLGYKIAEWIAYHAIKTSIEISREKGSFPALDKQLYRPLWRTVPKIDELFRKVGLEFEKYNNIEAPEMSWEEIEESYRKHGIRNATILSIAPTGSISIIAGTSSGIEPIFALAFLRIVSVGSFIEIDRAFLRDLKEKQIDEPWIIRKIAETGGIQELDFMPEDLKRIYKTAYEIDPIWHLMHQAVWQAWCDTGVSKTINLRNEEPVETVEKIYLLAWKLGIKGTTVYRDKSKTMQVLHKGIKMEKEAKEEAKTENGTLKTITLRGRETRLTAKKLRIEKKEIIAVEEEYAGGCPTCDL